MVDARAGIPADLQSHPPVGPPADDMGCLDDTDDAGTVDDTARVPTVGPEDRGWWLDANRTWHRDAPPPGWWQAHDGLWHPPAAEPILLPAYGQPYEGPSQDSAELAPMADRVDTTDSAASADGDPATPMLPSRFEPADIDAVIDAADALRAEVAAAAFGHVDDKDSDDDSDAPSFLPASMPPQPDAPALTNDRSDGVGDSSDRNRSVFDLVAIGDAHVDLVGDDADDGATAVAMVPVTDDLIDDGSPPPRHLAVPDGPRRWQVTDDGPDDADDYGAGYSDDDDDWDDRSALPAWAKYAVPVAAVGCALAFLAVALAPGSVADSDDGTRTDDPAAAESTSTTAGASTVEGAPASQLPSTTTTAAPPSTTSGAAPGSTGQPATTAAPPAPSTAPPATTAPPTTAAPSPPPPVTNVPQPEPCEPLGIPLDDVFCPD